MFFISFLNTERRFGIQPNLVTLKSTRARGQFVIDLGFFCLISRVMSSISRLSRSLVLKLKTSRNPASIP